MTAEAYTTQLQAGLGLIEETKKLLELWSPGLDSNELTKLTLQSGVFPNVTSRRLRNIVTEGFGTRYLLDDGYPAVYLKYLLPYVNNNVFNQILYLYTCRANVILADFIREVYWPSYIAGRDEITNEASRNFVEKANQQGKTTQLWADSTVRRVASYLTSCCADFGLLEAGNKRTRKILPFQPRQQVFLYLAYDLHFSGLGDNALMGFRDWQLFGLERDDVLQDFKRYSVKGWFIVQAVGKTVKIDWQYATMEDVLDVIIAE